MGFQNSVSALIKLMQLDCSIMNHDINRYQFSYAINLKCVSIVFYTNISFLPLPRLLQDGALASLLNQTSRSLALLRAQVTSMGRS